MPSISATKTASGATRYRARYQDPDGRQRERWFARKVDATNFLTTVESSKLDGSYINPSAGKVLFSDFAASWLTAQTFDDSTREGVEMRIRRHLDPTFGQMQLKAIRPSHVQAWLRGRQVQHAAGTVRLMFVNLTAIMSAAVDDGLIVRNPCSAAAVKPPPVVRGKVEPWTTEQVHAITAAHPSEYRAIPMIGAGAGLRQGEIFGLRVSDVDFLRRQIHVRQQVKIVGKDAIIAPPKRGKTRTVPLSDTLGFELAEHLRRHPTDELLFTYKGGLIRRHRFNLSVWQPALRAAGIAPTRQTGMHSLRHYYASVLLEAGVSIRTLAEYLGHDDPGFTLRVYTHLMPASEDRARQAIDAAFHGAEMGLEGADEA